MRKLTAILAVLLMATVGGLANAATMTVSAKYGGYTSVDTIYNGSARTILAGTFTANLSGYTPSFDAYCVDLSHYVNGPWDVTAQSTDLLTNGKGVAWLYDNYASTITDLEHGAALQIAIWKVLTDNDTNLSTGNFQLVTTGAIRTDVQTYLNAWNKTGQDTATWFVATSHPGNQYNQNMVGPRAVPEPGALSLLGAGLTGLTVAARRRRK